MVFEDRCEAGYKLAFQLRKLRLKRGLVLGLARGGVVVAAEIAKMFNWPLVALVFKKIGAPGNSELAIGAVGSSGPPYLDWSLIAKLNVKTDYLKLAIAQARLEAKKREELYQSGLRRMRELKLATQDVILVDDGLATGATVMAAIKFLKKFKPKRLILAIPIAPFSTAKNLADLVDRVIILHQDEHFQAVGQFYRNFSQVSDEQVINLLRQFS